MGIPRKDILLAILFFGIAVLAQYLPAKWGIPIGILAILFALWKLGFLWPLTRVRLKQGANKMVVAFGSILVVGGILGLVLLRSQLRWPTVATHNTTQETPASNQSFTLPTFVDLSKINPDQIVWLSLGSAHTGYSISTLQTEKKTTIDIGGAKIDMYIVGGRLCIDANVSDGLAEYPIQIKGNGFLVNNPNWDKNFDNNAFEVVNQAGSPIFQFILESQYSYILNGIFPIPGGGVVWANESGMIMKPSPFDTFQLQPLFKYPSTKFQGQRVKP